MTMYLLDTNIISELVRKKPAEAVLDWVRLQPEETLHLSVITIAEIMRGVSKLVESERKTRLINWVWKELPARFESRIIPFNTECAYCWGDFQGRADRSGTPYSMMDLQVAVTAIHHELVLVTRNVKDFRGLPVDVFNPWGNL